MSDSDHTSEDDENEIPTAEETEDEQMSSDDENTTSTASANGNVEQDQNGSQSSDGLRWDRSRSRRYNLEMLREYEQRRCNEIVSRLVEAHHRQLNDGSSSDDDAEDKQPIGPPDCRGIYAAIEAKWRNENTQPPQSPARQHSSLTRDKSFTRKTTGVMAATRFKSAKKFQLRNNIK